MEHLESLLLSYPYMAVSAWICSPGISAALVGCKSRSLTCCAVVFTIAVAYLIGLLLPASGLV
jgi:hypothetical protein